VNIFALKQTAKTNQWPPMHKGNDSWIKCKKRIKQRKRYIKEVKKNQKRFQTRTWLERHIGYALFAP
jgi:hypothetical protein